MTRQLKSACTHTQLRTAGPLVIDRAAKLLLPHPDRVVLVRAEPCAAQPISDRPGVLQNEFGVMLRAVSSLVVYTSRALCQPHGYSGWS
jgi:hypothetical protein